MSDSSFPFDAPVDATAGMDDDTAGGRNPVVLIGGLVGAMVLAAGGWFLLGGDAAEEDLALPVRAPKAAAPAPADSAAAVIVPAAATQTVGRNPFKALYVAPKAAAAPAQGGTTTEGAPTGTSGTGGEGATGSTGGAAGAAGGSTGGTSGGSKGVAEQPKTPPKYLSVAVVDPNANQVTFKLLDREAAKPEDRDQTVIVKPGEVFATYFKLIGYGTLLDANNNPRNCTDLLYGDTRLKLCEGESYQLGA